jgi:hypothetical protein
MLIGRENLFENIDFFSKSFEFTFGGKDKFRSNIGGYFTIFTFFMGLYWVWLLGNEIIYKNNPKNNQSVAFRENPLNLSLIVPYGFMVQDYRGQVLKNYQKYITFEAFYWNKKRSDGQYVDVEPPKKLNLRNCDPNDFSEEVYKDFKRLELGSATCLDEPQQVLGGDLTSDFAKYISVRVTPCYNTTERKNCASHNESFAFVNTKTLVISVKSEKIIYDSTDYKHPVKKYIGEDNVLADPFIFNFPRYEMYEFNVNTDDGLVGQSSSDKAYYELVFLNDIISAFDNNYQMPTDFSKLILFEYSFFESPTIKTQYRSYLKLTDVLASLGGILKVYLVIFNFAFHQIYQRIMYEQVITQLFNFEKVKRHDYKTKKTGTNTVTETIKKLDEKEEIKIVFDNKSEKDDENSKKPLNTKSSKTLFTNNYLNQQNGDAISETSNNFHLNLKSPTIVTKKIPTILGRNNTEKSKRSNYTNSAVSALFSKKKIESQTKRKNIFSLYDHLILSFLPCCSKCSFKLKNVNDKFTKLIEYMNNYIDVLQMMRQFHELERLKFVLFNKKQLAIFQNIGIPEDPLHKKIDIRLNNFYDFQYDHKAQKKKAKEFFIKERKTTNGNDSRLTTRLKKLYLN